MTNTNNETFAEHLTDLLRRLVCEIILNPERLRISHVCMSRSVTLYMEASAGDTPRIIGTGGAHYRALAAIAAAAGRKQGLRVELDKLAEPTDRTQDRYPEFVTKQYWPSHKVMRLLLEVGQSVFQHEESVSYLGCDGPSGTTNIELLVREDEPAQLVAEMGVALPALFKSIGKANGRRLFLNVVPSVAREQQPRSAAGRFSGEVER